MANYYPDNADMVTRAAQTWPILAMLAYQHDTMSYGDLAVLLDMHHRPMGSVLGYVMNYCEAHDLPPLTAVIVSASTGKPGAGLTTAPDTVAALDKVYSYSWWRVVAPTIEELRAAK